MKYWLYVIIKLLRKITEHLAIYLHYHIFEVWVFTFHALFKLIKKKKCTVLLNTTATKPECEPIPKCNYSISRGKPLQRFPALQVTFKARLQLRCKYSVRRGIGTFSSLSWGPATCEELAEQRQRQRSPRQHRSQRCCCCLQHEPGRGERPVAAALLPAKPAWIGGKRGNLLPGKMTFNRFQSDFC